MEVSPVPVIEEEVPKKPAAAPAEVALKAAPESGIFTVEIPLPASKPAQLGLDLDAIDSKGPIIVSVMPGVLKDFNDANPALSLEAYDRIEAVNGETGEPSKLYK
ncbi:Ank3, partial [Symbiodinium microadriaticum]